MLKKAHDLGRGWGSRKVRLDLPARIKRNRSYGEMYVKMALQNKSSQDAISELWASPAVYLIHVEPRSWFQRMIDRLVMTVRCDG